MKIHDHEAWAVQNKAKMEALATAMEDLYLALKEREFQPAQAQALVESAFKGVINE